MTPFTFHGAGSLVVGRGCVARLGALVAERFAARRAFVVTDANLAAAGLVERAAGPLRDAGLTVEVFAGCVAEPPAEVVLAAADAAKAFGPDCVVGLGGGSNLDTAKLVALLLTHGGTLADYAGDSRVPGPVLPLACVPTTAGTGSEVSPAAVFTDTAAAMKLSCLSRHLRPALAVVDGALTDGCPRQVTADSGIDALAHAIEAYTARGQAEFQAMAGGPSVYQGKNPLADLMAAEAIRLVGRFLVRAVNAPADAEARDGMALAATLGGLAFSNAGVALTHAMEYPVGGAVHVSHGAGNGLLLPHVMRFNEPGRSREFAEIAGLLGHPGPAWAAVEALRDAVGIPARLRDLGVTEAMLPGFAEKAFAIKRLLRVNPRTPADPAELLAVYRAAF